MSRSDPTSSFAEASVLGVDFSYLRGLTKEHVESMFMDDGETILPPNLKDCRPSSWPNEPLSQREFEELLKERELNDDIPF
jgi:hypothetical protein